MARSILSNGDEPNHCTEFSDESIRISDVQLKVDADRLRTFNGFERLFTVDVKDLAFAGFIYAGTKDRVRCVCCGKEIEDWKHNDMPLIDHRRVSRNCSLVQEQYKLYSKEKYTTENSYENNSRRNPACDKGCSADLVGYTTHQLTILIKTSHQSDQCSCNILVSCIINIYYPKNRHILC